MPHKGVRDFSRVLSHLGDIIASADIGAIGSDPAVLAGADAVGLTRAVPGTRGRHPARTSDATDQHVDNKQHENQKQIHSYD